MDKILGISMNGWLEVLKHLAGSCSLYAPVTFNGSIDYEPIDNNNATDIIYNHPKPTTPLKTFFLPVKENVTSEIGDRKKMVIMGIPACDLAALDILDEMYLIGDYVDIYYKNRRENSILIGSDCHSILDNCHCTSYGVNPYPEKQMDLILVRMEERVFIRASTNRGNTVLQGLNSTGSFEEATEDEEKRLTGLRLELREALNNKNIRLPDYKSSGQLVKTANGEIWSSYASSCVSCGACAAICPTCTCFLLVDRPGFEKVRQMDACQYPGFERVAAGEDPLGGLTERFKNRYQCKYVWKPLKFMSPACTGCGRCTDSCIGKIDKNELLTGLALQNQV